MQTVEVLRQTNKSTAALAELKAIFHGYDLAKSQGFLRVNDIDGIQQGLVDNTTGIKSTPGTVLKNSGEYLKKDLGNYLISVFKYESRAI